MNVTAEAGQIPDECDCRLGKYRMNVTAEAGQVLDARDDKRDDGCNWQ